MINWTGLNQANKTKILLAIIGALLTVVGYFFNENYEPQPQSQSDSGKQTSQATALGQLDKSGTTAMGGGVDFSGMNMGDGSTVNFSGGNTQANDYSRDTMNANNTENANNTLSSNNMTNSNNTSNSNNTTNSNNTSNSNNTTIDNSQTIINNGPQAPTEKQIAVEAKRRQKDALLQKKKDILQQVRKQFRDPYSFTLNPGSLSDALENYAKRQSVLADIELNFSAQTQQQAELFFDNARKAIACAWGESNRPQTCQVNDARHPEKRYKALFATLKSNMSRDIAAAVQ